MILIWFYRLQGVFTKMIGSRTALGYDDCYLTPKLPPSISAIIQKLIQLMELAAVCRKRWKTGALFSVILKSSIPRLVIKISNYSCPPGYALLPHFP